MYISNSHMTISYYLLLVTIQSVLYVAMCLSSLVLGWGHEIKLDKNGKK